MPTTSQEGETAAESPKKIENGGGEVKEEISDSQTSKNGLTKEDSESKAEEAKESEEVDKEKLLNEASTLLAQGKRHLFVKDYPSAVNALGDACAKFSALYGDLGDECADAYFNYGCALLELAREESGVLDVDNKDKESEEEKDGEDEGEEAGQDEKKDQEKPTEDETNETEQKSTNEACDENETKSAEEKVEGDETIADDEDEDVNNLQLAWEMFELAKVIFARNNEEMKLADTYLRLGEVALESENYGSAITDIQNCLDLQQKVLPPVSREIAETLFQLGVACSLCNQFDDAIKHFTAAGVLLEKRIQKLIKMTEPDPEKAKNPFYTIEKEIDEIKALLPEIKDKIIDMEEFKNETMKAVVQATIGNVSKETADGAGPSTNGTPSSSSASPSKPVNDISHLVRKKRKNPEDDSPVEAKKSCSESKTT